MFKAYWTGQFFTNKQQLFLFSIKNGPDSGEILLLLDELSRLFSSCVKSNSTLANIIRIKLWQTTISQVYTSTPLNP